MAKKSFQRKVILINPKFQLKISGYFAILSIINIGIFYGCIRYFFSLFTKMGAEVGLPKNHVYFMFVEDQVMAMNIVFGVTSLITISFLMFSGVYISHKVAGPLYRLNKCMREMANGEMEVSEINFRNGDFFQELADGFNLFIKRKND